jgi:hypothetical protein
MGDTTGQEETAGDFDDESQFIDDMVLVESWAA